MTNVRQLFRPDQPEEEGAAVREANEGTLQEGETMYVVASKWWRKWTGKEERRTSAPLLLSGVYPGLSGGWAPAGGAF